IGTAAAQVPFIAARKSVTFGSGLSLDRAPSSALCSAQPQPAVSPPPQPAPPPPSFEPASVAFFDQDHGIVVGPFTTPGCESGCSGRIQITSDGGRTWTQVLRTRHQIVSVTVFGTSDAWAVENDPCAYLCPALLHSTDGGRTWKKLGEVNVINPSFVSSTLGYAVAYQRDGANAPVVTTTDGGRTWRQVSRPCGPNTYSGWGEYPAFVSPTHGWILCNGQPSA